MVHLWQKGSWMNMLLRPVRSSLGSKYVMAVTGLGLTFFVLVHLSGNLLIFAALGFLAPWCPHCKDYMPKFLRVISDAKNPRIKLNLYGVPKGFTVAPGPWQGRNINSIPTLLLFNKGEVTDQIVGMRSKREIKARFDPVAA